MMYIKQVDMGGVPVTLCHVFSHWQLHIYMIIGNNYSLNSNRKSRLKADSHCTRRAARYDRKCLLTQWCR